MPRRPQALAFDVLDTLCDTSSLAPVADLVEVCERLLSLPEED